MEYQDLDSDLNDIYDEIQEVLGDPTKTAEVLGKYDSKQLVLLLLAAIKRIRMDAARLALVEKASDFLLVALDDDTDEDEIDECLIGPAGMKE